LVSSASNTLTLNDNCTAINANNTSYVDGPVTKVGDDAFAFPVGRSNQYHPISISPPSNSSDQFTAEYFFQIQI